MAEKAILQEMMIDSLNTLYEKDQYLIWNCEFRYDNHVGERAIMFRF